MRLFVAVMRRFGELQQQLELLASLSREVLIIYSNRSNFLGFIAKSRYSRETKFRIGKYR